MIDSIPYNLKFKIGEHLREVPENREGFKKGIKFLEEQLAVAPDPETRAKCLSTMGVLRRIIGDTENSLQNLEEAEKIFQQGESHKLGLINQVRKAVSLEFAGKYKAAMGIYDELERYIKKNPRHKNLLDFIYQHRGKNEFEQGNHEKALALFRIAHRLRLDKENKDLIASTNHAIKVVEKAMAKG